jgi:hypothetical protein
MSSKLATRQFRYGGTAIGTHMSIKHRCKGGLATVSSLILDLAAAFPVATVVDSSGRRDMSKMMVAEYHRYCRVD